MSCPFEIVVRCKNEMPHVERTLAALASTGARVLFIDSGSTDGSLETAFAAGVDVVQIAPQSYVPGRVLNDAMRRTRGDVVAFVNADAVPLDVDSVAKLVRACRAGAAAAYGRQLPRAGARPLTAIDHARAFPGGKHDESLRDFFSMAASAVRRDVWEALPFDENLRFSEDVDWTLRLRALGFAITYVPDARFEHSHDYDAPGMARRMEGEGEADAAIRRRGPPDAWRNLARPFVGAVARDARAGGLSVEGAKLRWSAQRGRFTGLRRGTSGRVDDLASAPLPGLDCGRFTTEGKVADEAVVQRILDGVRVRVEGAFGPSAIATVLVGSFGCGDGGVRHTGDVARLRGDLDLVVVFADRRGARAARSRCEHIGEEVSRASAAVVDLWPVSRAELEDHRGRLLWIDAAVRGAKIVAGKSDILGALRGLGARAASSDEIGRLLANRATGVALSRLAAEAGEHDPVHAAHHVAKAWLGVGDALLLLADCYAPTPGERVATLSRFADLGASTAQRVALRYAWAQQTRTSPSDTAISRIELESHATELWRVHAILEARRLPTACFATPEEYAGQRGALYGNLADVEPAARFLAGARAAARQIVRWRCAARHPRDTLARVAVVLAFASDRRGARAFAAGLLTAADDAPAAISRALVAARAVGA